MFGRSNVLTADTAIDFMFKVLSNQPSTFSQDLIEALAVRIKYRRTNCSSVLQYLHTGKMEYSHMGRPFRNHFSEPKTSVIVDLVKKFALRYGHNEESVNESLESSQELMVDIVNPEKDLKEQLIEAIKKTKDAVHTPNLNSNNTRSQTAIIKKEMSLWETTGAKGSLLTATYHSLLSIPPTSVESERAFSSAGYLCNKIRTRMSDKTLDSLCFLRSFFRK